MRTLMTFLTLGAASAGYVYLQAPAAGEPYSSRPVSPPLFDWSRESRANVDTSRVPLKDLVDRIHEHARSALDDFSDRSDGQPVAPVDDAFQRLRQVAQSAVTSQSNSGDGSNRGISEWTKASRAPLPNLDELQRTAFEPAAEVEPSNNLTTPRDNNVVARSQDERAADSRDAVASGKPVEVRTPVAVQAIAGSLEPTVTSDRSKPVQTNEPVSVDQAVSRISQIGTKKTLQRDVKIAPAEWKVVGKSTEGRPMHSMHLGDTGTRTLVVAGLNGTDRTAVRWLELLAEELARRPALLKNNEVVFFRAGNPDGLVRNVRNNARGVSLNRNFPSRRYRPTNDMPPFATPASEVETRIMLDTLYTFRPRRVIHLTATTGQSEVLHNRLATRIATDLEQSARVKLLPLDAEQHPGSLEDFADGTLEAAVVSMRLGVGDDWQKAWTTLQPHVLSAVVGQPIEAPAGEVTQAPDPDRSPIRLDESEPVAQPSRRRGYEELPAPPQ